MINILYQNKKELKVFFTIWLCLFFIFSPISMGLFLTPKIELLKQQEAKAWLANIITDIISWIGNNLAMVWANVQQWAIAAWNWVEQHIYDVIKEALNLALQIAIYQVLAMVTNSIIAWIQSDFQGQPGFITDWSDYLKKAGDAAAGRFINELTGSNFCGAFSANLKASLSLPVPTFNEYSGCTLDDFLTNLGTSLDNFKEDFNNGGWLAWQDMSNPNNNAFAVWLATIDEKTAREFNESQKLMKETKSGFKPTKKCLSGSKTTYSCAMDGTLNGSTCTYADGSSGSAISSTSTDASSIDPNSADCTSAMTTGPDGTVEFTTNLAATSAFRSIEAQMAQLTGKAGGTFAPFIGAIANALITQLVKDGVSGLTGMVADAAVNDDGSTTSTDTSGALNTEALCLANSGEWNSETSACTTTTSGTIDTAASTDGYESIMNDYAIIESVKGNLDQVDTSSSNSITQSLLSAYTALAATTTDIKNKQLEIMTTKWSSGYWKNETNDTDGTETVDDDATATEEEGAIVDGPTTVGTETTTITTTTYTITHSRIGEASITEIKTEITNTRTTSAINYDSTTYSYSLNAVSDPTDSTYKCASDYPSSEIQCQIDTDGWNYQDKVDSLSSLSELVSLAETTADNFKSYAETYDNEFSASSTSEETSSAYNNADSARQDLINSLDALTGSTSSSLSDSNDALVDYINGSLSGFITDGNITVTDSSTGTSTTETATTYFQTYYNDVVTIYNNLSQ